MKRFDHKNLVVSWEYGSGGHSNKASTSCEYILEIIAMISYHVESSTEVTYCFPDRM